MFEEWPRRGVTGVGFVGVIRVDSVRVDAVQDEDCGRRAGGDYNRDLVRHLLGQCISGKTRKRAMMIPTFSTPKTSIAQSSSSAPTCGMWALER